jgi:glycosyltransferase involved in cell wall biosynthesis
MPEFARDAAILFDPYKPNELASLLAHYIDNQPEMERLGRLALQQSETFSWKLSAEKTWQVVLNLK